MGLYIEPNQDKQDWLNENGTSISELPKDLSSVDASQLPVALLDNGMFLAGAVAFNQNELNYFLDSIERGDGRDKTFYLVSKEKLKEVCPQYSKYMRE